MPKQIRRPKPPRRPLPEIDPRTPSGKPTAN
jgi:hypothetical protein